VDNIASPSKTSPVLSAAVEPPWPSASMAQAFVGVMVVAATFAFVHRYVPSVLVDAARAGADHEFTANHLTARLEQFFDETFVIVPHAADALANNDVQQFGSLVDRSQGGAERALENQIAETVHLARYARELGAHAASAFGAGFGGSVWAMVRASEAERFATRWRDRYLRTHRSASHRALFFATSPSAPAFEVVDDTARADT
jgi:galactokinase